MRPTIDMTDEELKAIFEDESRSDAERLDAWMFTPSNDWFCEAVPLIHNVLAQRAACAAGPWRYDVENAPKDGSMIWASWHKPSNPEAVFVTSLHWWENYKTWRGHGFDVREEWIINFTIPNPPQTTGEDS